MARIRTIKPEFWTSEQVMELSPLARLAFIGLWNFCDDRGVHPASQKTLKAEVFPADDVTAAQVEQWVAEMVKQGLLAELENDGGIWWQVVRWERFFSGEQSARPSRHIWDSIRSRIFARDSYTCTYC